MSECNCEDFIPNERDYDPVYLPEPKLEYKTVIMDSGDPGYVNRIMVGTPATGLVRVEWMQGRIGQVIPVNWSMVQMYEFMNSYIPLRYQVADAQNMICKVAVEKDFQWLLLWEHDNIPLPDATVRINKYIQAASHPVVSGLYFNRGDPSEPLIFRGKGTGAYWNWKMGDHVYCDGVPTGFLLIHMGLIKAMWDDSEEYELHGAKVRRIFNTPRDIWWEPQTGFWNTTSGTSDLEWCTRVIKGDYMRKAGWGKYVDGLEDKRYPFMVDTNLFSWHIEPDGTRYPKVMPVTQTSPPPLGVNVTDKVNTGDKPGG